MVIPGFTPAWRAGEETCHRRRESSSESKAVGFPTNSGRLSSSQRSGKRGIQIHTASSLVRLEGGSGIAFIGSQKRDPNISRSYRIGKRYTIPLNPLIT